MVGGRRRETRDAIIEAAVGLIATDGVTVSTALVAKRAGVAQGSVFNHFETKGALLNAVFVQLKGEVDAAVLDDLPPVSDIREELRTIWNRWMDWGVANPTRQRALFLLDVSDVLTVASREATKERLSRGVDVYMRAASGGAFRGQPIEFLGAIVSALGNATMETIVREPTKANNYRDVGFEALWNMLNRSPES